MMLTWVFALFDHKALVFVFPQYCTHAFFDNPSISKWLFVLTQNPSNSEGTLMQLLGSECVAQDPGGLLILGSETTYFL